MLINKYFKVFLFNILKYSKKQLKNEYNIQKNVIFKIIKLEIITKLRIFNFINCPSFKFIKKLIFLLKI